MGSSTSKSKIQGTSIAQHNSASTAADSTIIKDFVKGSFASLCHIDTSSETLNQILRPVDSPVPVPNRFTLKAILKSPKNSLDSSLDSPESSSKSSVGFNLDTDSDSQLNSSCWSCGSSNMKDSFESYSPKSKISCESQASSLQSMRASTASLSSRKQIEHPPIYKSANGDYYIAFDSSKYVLSSGYICPNDIHIDGHSFASAEHVYLYNKALFHNSSLIANQILMEDDVHEARKLVKCLETMNHSKWRKVQVNIMRRACLTKFEQNPQLRRELFRTGQATLVAAIADCYFGVGLSIDDLNITDPSKWRGSNLLGQVLMAVRTLLASQYVDEFQNEQLIAEKRQQKCIKL